MKKIPLRNIKKEIIAYTMVSVEDFKHLNEFKWSKGKDNYVKSTIYKEKWSLHRYIILEILKKEIPKGFVVDHKDNNTLNNCRENLRIITLSENARNKKKKKDCSSQYIGVSFDPRVNRFQVNLKVPNMKKLYATYVNEIHAAYQYNLWIDKYNLKGANKNVLEIPTDFVQWIKKENTKTLPKGIREVSGKFIVVININGKKKNLGSFKTLEKAIEAREKAEIERQESIQNKILAIPKQFNKENFCFFKIKDKEIIIDEDLFYDIMKYKWCISGNYIQSTVNGKTAILSRFIMNCSDERCVDHINGKTLDNRRDNLRIVTTPQNNMNKSSAINSTSQYVGVYFGKHSRKWMASITNKGTTIALGSFNTEIEAVKVRDIATVKYFGINGRLNFPENYKSIVEYLYENDIVKKNKTKSFSIYRC